MSQNPPTAFAGTPAAAHVAGPATTSRLTPLDPLRILRKYTWLWVIVGVVGIGLGVLISVLCEQFIPEYTSRSTLLVSTELKSVYDPAADPQATRDRSDSLTTFLLNQVERIRSQQVLNFSLQRQEVRNTEWFNSFPSGTRDAFEDLRDQLEVKVVRGSSLIEVSFSGTIEDDMATIVDAVNRSFLEQYRVDLLNQQSAVRVMMSRELGRARDEQEEIEKEMEAFLEEHDVPKLSSRDTEAEINYEALAERKVQLELVLEQLRQSAIDLQRQRQDPQTNGRPESAAAVDRDPNILQRVQRLERLREQRVLLNQRLGRNHRIMRLLDEDIAVLNSEINRLRDQMTRQLMEAQETGIRKQMEKVFLEVQALDPKLDEAREQLRDLDAKAEEFDRIDERRETVKDRYDRADELLEDLRVRELRPEHVRIRVQQQPTLAELTFPNYWLMIPGITVLCLGLTGGLVFLMELLDQRIKAPSDLELVTDAPLLGALPATVEDPSGPASMDGIVQKDPTGLIAESFRQVRTEVLAQMDRRGYKTLLLTGAQAECGTSSVVSNLATSIAFNDRRVVIVDANFRRPRQCKLHDTAQEPGLVEVLRQNASLEDAVVSRQDPDVDVLPAGACQTTPPEILEGPAFANLLAALESRYDIVLIDAPPALVASDARLLTKQVDAAALVVRAKVEKRGMVRRVIRELSGQRADILGIVLNGVRSSTGGYFRKNYQAFYRYREPTAAKDSGKKRKAATEQPASGT